MLRVLVATPLGRGGNGGIDRLMDSLDDALRAHPIPGLAVTFAVTRGPGSIWLAPVRLAVALFRLILLRLAGRVDVLHLNLSSFGSTYRKLIMAWAARAIGVPYVVHLHGGEYDRYYSGARRFVRRAIVRMLERAKTVIVLGSTWRDFIAAIAPDSRIVVLPNATPPRAIPPRAALPAPPVHIAFMGRLGVRKGVPELVEAAALLACTPGWTMTIAGDGAVAETRAALHTLGLTDRVRVPGWLGPEAADAVIESAHVLVLPSRAENLPMSVIEGMAAGCAVIATPVGATADIIADGKTGLLIPPGDAVTLAGALQRLIADHGLRACLGSAAQDYHREYLSIGGYVPRLAMLWKAAGEVG